MCKELEEQLNQKFDEFGLDVWTHYPDDRLSALEEICQKHFTCNQFLSFKFFADICQYASKQPEIYALIEAHFPRTIKVTISFNLFFDSEKPDASEFESLVGQNHLYEVDDDAWHDLIKGLRSMLLEQDKQQIFLQLYAHDIQLFHLYEDEVLTSHVLDQSFLGERSARVPSKYYQLRNSPPPSKPARF